MLLSVEWRISQLVYKGTLLGYAKAEDTRHMRPIHSNGASVLGMSVSTVAVIYHSPATGSVTG